MSHSEVETRERSRRRPDTNREQSRFAQRVLVATGLAGGLIALFFLLWNIAQVLLLVFAGILLAVFLRGVSDRVSDYTGLSPGWALASVLLVLIALLGAGVWLLAPELTRQIDQFTEQFPEALDEVEQRLQQFEWGQRLVEQGREAGRLAPVQTSIVSRITGAFSGALEFVVNVVVVLIVGLYLAANPKPYIEGAILLLPPGKRRRGREVLSALGETLWRWLAGQLIAMVAVGTLTALGLTLIGAPLGFTFGLLTGLLEFIPIIGPAIGIAPAILLAVVQSPVLALYVVLVYAAVQLAESYLILPLAQLVAVDLPPALTIISQVTMGVLFGPLGVLLATPLVATTIVLVKMLYVEDLLGDPVTLPGDDDRDEHSQVAPARQD